VTEREGGPAAGPAKATAWTALVTTAFMSLVVTGAVGISQGIFAVYWVRDLGASRGSIMAAGVSASIIGGFMAVPMGSGSYYGNSVINRQDFTVRAFTGQESTQQGVCSFRGELYLAYHVAHEEKPPFDDHHRYSEDDLGVLAQMAEERSAALVTTEKDAARLSPEWRARVSVLPIRARFDDEAALDALLAPIQSRMTGAHG